VNTELNGLILKSKKFLEYPSDQHHGLISKRTLLDRITVVMTAVSITVLVFLFVCLFFLLSFLTPFLSITGCFCLPPFYSYILSVF
jgi:hypothetical protein